MGSGQVVRRSRSRCEVARAVIQHRQRTNTCYPVFVVWVYIVLLGCTRSEFLPGITCMNSRLYRPKARATDLGRGTHLRHGVHAGPLRAMQRTPYNYVYSSSSTRVRSLQCRTHLLVYLRILMSGFRSFFLTPGVRAVNELALDLVHLTLRRFLVVPHRATLFCRCRG